MFLFVPLLVSHNKAGSRRLDLSPGQFSSWLVLLAPGVRLASCVPFYYYFVFLLAQHSAEVVLFIYSLAFDFGIAIFMWLGHKELDQ